MTMTVWKTISVNENYEVSSCGRIRPKVPRYRSVQELKPIPTSAGYDRVCLSRKLYLIHRLVATAFIENPEGFLEINHKDEDKHNNSVDNLEWCNRSYNQSYSKGFTRKVLSPDGKIVEFNNLRSFCRENNLDGANLNRVLRGERLHHKGWRATK